MSGDPAPIFKRTKSRPTRVRPPSPDAEDTGTKEETGSGAMSLMTKFKNKQKARAKPQAKLSFGQDEEDGSDAPTPKRQESGRKSKLANPAAMRMPDSLEQASISRTTSAPVYNKAYLDELKAATLSAPVVPTPNSQDAEMTLSIDEMDGAMVVDNDVDVGDVFDTRPTEIPMSSAVIEAKKKRERMRATGKTAPEDDFISLSMTRREDMDVDQGPHPESRLMREDDDLGEGDDDDAEYTGAQERIALGKKGRKEAERQRKAGMIEMIEDVEEDEETQAWELAQVRRGGNNNRTAVVEEKQVYKAHPIPTQTPVPTLDPAMLRLTQALTKLTTSHAGNTKSLIALGEEHASLEQQEARLRLLVTEAEEKRAWFDGFREWMDSLADFLDEKFPKVEKIEEDFISLLTERAEMLSKRRQEDLGDDLVLFLGPPPSDTTEMEAVDDLGRTLPSSSAPQSAVRRARRATRQARRTKRTGASSRPNEGYSTDGSLGSDDEGDFEVAVKRCRERAVGVFEDVTSEEFRDPRKGVARWFGKWRKSWGESYQGAWGSLGVVGAWEMWCRLEICLWDPLVDRRTLDEFRWYNSLHEFSRPANDAGESGEPSPDEDLVLSMVATAVIPRVAKLVEGGALDPFSAKHIRRLKDLAEQIEATVEADPTKMNALLGACLGPLRKAVDEAQVQLRPYLAPSQAPLAFDPDSVPARVRYITRMGKLLANLVAWRKYTGEKYGVGELIERLLGRIMLPVAEGGWEVGGEDAMRKAIIGVPRECVPAEVIARLG
ncbi:GCFC-domain-containing protein [Ceratobasidium sp. AG-I]|nr:GCFC-domain-containing protein [Ceratobasidium sp. AG-I]